MFGCSQDKDGPKALEEFCRDLCEEVRMNKIDPVSEQQPMAVAVQMFLHTPAAIAVVVASCSCVVAAAAV
jgi:hypothetical protein